MNFPQMTLIKQTFDRSRVEDIPATVAAELERIGVRSKVKPGQKVAITAGSRGIANVAVVTKAVVDFMKGCGAEPFIFPAMGSHAAAIAEKQKDLLGVYGISEESMGCPILSTMEVDEIGRNPDGLPIFLDKYARTADHIVVINRVKPHTKFEGAIESGLMKMMAIGMGKRHGADLYHKACIQFGMNRVIETVGLIVMDKCPVLCGLGLVENGYDETAIIRAVLPGDLVEEEEKLLLDARRLMARIPFSDIDLLIIDEMGKNISGTGMDTNVTGVNRDILGDFSSEPRTKRLFVRDLTPESEGNAVGIGLADFTTTRLVNKIDKKKTYINCLTGISPEKAAIPMHFDSDRDCVTAAINCLGMVKPEEVRIVHLRNTLALEKLNVSKAYLPEIEKREDLEIIGQWQTLAFGPDQNLISPF
ncbi:MAG: DUF2088 domain-containing protein [Deltaproteobacteria bacterium]|nr:DUF2088 domain-containing protein [Deltaproteobacteria bacterium]